MRALTVIGILLVLFGIAGLAFQSVTFFTSERVVDTAWFQLDVQRPHTIVVHPAAAVAALLAGLVMLVLGSRSTP